MASIEVLRGRIRRDELRAAVAACGTWAQQRDWRNSNGEIQDYIENNPHVRNPKDIAKRFLGRNSAAVRAERIAKPHGGRGKDIVREQAEFWLERKLPENPYVLFAHLHFGGGTGVAAAAELSDLPIATAWTLALRGLGQTYREIGALESALGRSMANAHWLRFLDAIETGQCVCECPHCSLNVPERRNGIVRLLRTPKSILNRKAGTSNGSDLVSGRASRKASGGRAGCDTGNDKGTGRYATVELAGGLKVLAHRWAWIRERGGIPCEHDIHHLDRNIANNDVGNLELLPRWAHRLVHKR